MSWRRCLSTLKEVTTVDQRLSLSVTWIEIEAGIYVCHSNNVDQMLFSSLQIQYLSRSWSKGTIAVVCHVDFVEESSLTHACQSQRMSTVQFRNSSLNLDNKTGKQEECNYQCFSNFGTSSHGEEWYGGNLQIRASIMVVHVGNWEAIGKSNSLAYCTWTLLYNSKTKCSLCCDYLSHATDS